MTFLRLVVLGLAIFGGYSAVQRVRQRQLRAPDAPGRRGDKTISGRNREPISDAELVTEWR